MKLTAIYVSSGLVSVVLALPTPQLGESWGGFFGPDPGYYPYGAVHPYYPPTLQAPAGMRNPVPAPPPLLAPMSHGMPYEDPGAPVPPRPPQPPALYYPPPVPAPGPFDNGPQDHAARPSGSVQPPPPPRLELPPPKAPAPSHKPSSKPVSEKPHDKKPLASKFVSELEDSPPPVVVEEDDEFDKDAIRYHVNVGGIQRGAGGGTTNFHVYSDENGNKHFSDELDENTEKYITENMIPKLGGKKRGGNRGGVWSVFGDK